MSSIKSFIWTTVLGGIAVLLPAALFLFLTQWLAKSIAGLLQPVVDVVVESGVGVEWYAYIVVLVLLFGACFGVGYLVRTRLGRWSFELLEGSTLARLPGYGLIKETVQQFIGTKKSPFASVALVDLFGNGTLVTAFVTDGSRDDLHTVFVPTGPNPTSGNICHLPRERVHPVDIPVETAMRSIISCGAGSATLVAAHMTPEAATPGAASAGS